MIRNHKVLAVIPARAGSKRCPGKNKRLFRGRPLIMWSIETALASKLIDVVVVSTDDGDIARMVKYPAHFLPRPEALATDAATNEDVMRHALEQYTYCDWALLLQPTSPLRAVRDIERTLTEAMYCGFEAACTYSEGGKKNGAVYACSAQWLRDGKDFTNYYADPYFMAEDRSLDIDYLEQFA